MAVKFSQFTPETAAADVTDVVGYKGTANLRIPPANLDTLYSLSTTQNAADIDFKLTGTKTGTATTNETIALKPAGGITLTAGADEITISSADTNTTYTFESAANAANVDLTLTSSTAVDDTVLITAAGGISFSSVTAAGFTISSTTGGSGWTATGDSGSEAVSDGGSIDFEGGDAITTTAATGPKVTFDLDDTGVTYAKIQDVAANSLLVRDANSAGVLSAKALATTEILIGNGTGFTAASLGTDVTMDNAGAVTIANDVVTNAKLGVEYTDSEPLVSGAAIAVNTDLADVFTYTSGVSNTLNFTNVVIGDMKSFVITGGGSTYTVTLGTSNTAACTYNKITGTYDDTGGTKNLLQIKWIATNEAWYSISQPA